MLEDLARQYSGGGGRAASNGAAKRGGKRSRGGGEKIQEKLLATLKSGKGLQLKDVVKRSGLDSGAVQYHLRKLRASKKARLVGDRKEARWYSA